MGWVDGWLSLVVGCLRWSGQDAKKLRRTKCKMTREQSGQNAYKSFGVLSVDILTYHPLLSLQTRFIHHGVLLLLLFLIPIQHGFGVTVGTVELWLCLFQSAFHVHFGPIIEHLYIIFVLEPSVKSVISTVGGLADITVQGHLVLEDASREKKTLPKAQQTRGLSSYHKFHTNLDPTSISESRLSIDLKISTKHQHLN